MARAVKMLYRWLLRAYPPSVRRRFGNDMSELFAGLRREGRRDGGRFAAAGVVIRTLVELPFSAWHARRSGSDTRPAQRVGSNMLHGPTPGHAPSTTGPINPRGGASQVVLHGFRNGLRNVLRDPGFTAVVAGTLALGIGASTVVFTVIQGVLLAPLPYHQPDELVRVYQLWSRTPPELGMLSGAALREYRRLDDLFEGIAIFHVDADLGADLVIDGEPERILTMPIGAGSFAALGVAPALGREFRRDEEHQDAGVAIISHDLWQRYFDGDPDVLGRSLELDGEMRIIVGAMPAGYRNPIGHPTGVWVPAQLLPVTGERWDPNHWDNHYLSAVARLRDGVTPARAHARLDALVAEYEERYEGVDGQSARLVPLLQDQVGDTASMLWVLAAAVGMVLSVSCVNVANLLLARHAGRSRELAVRAALGAGRGRLAVQVLAESLLLGVVGGLAGLAVSIGGLRAVLALSPDGLPRAADIGMDPAAFAFAAGLSLLTGLLFGAAPALRFARPDLDRALRHEGCGHSAARALTRLRGTLVVAEVALALMLLFGAGLLTTSFANLLAVDLGIDSSGVLTYEVRLPDERYPDGGQRVAFYKRLFPLVEAIPGVDAVGAVSVLPATDAAYQWGFRRLDLDPDDPAARGAPNVRVIDGDYLEVMRIHLLRGRDFGPQDTLTSPKVMLINEVLADRLYPDRDPLGARVRLAVDEFEIVGIVASSARDARGNRGPDVYLSHDQHAVNRNWAMTHTVRVAGKPSSIVSSVRDTLRQVDPRLALYDVRPMDEVVAAGTSSQRFAMALMTAFAVIAALLAVVGIYGLLSYTVAARTHEIGIRMALGANHTAVRNMVLRQALALVALGVAFGVAGALALSGWLAAMLFDVSVSDPAILASVIALLALVAALAAYVPARQATMVDPMRALRN